MSHIAENAIEQARAVLEADRLKSPAWFPVPKPKGRGGSRVVRIAVPLAAAALLFALGHRVAALAVLAVALAVWASATLQRAFSRFGGFAGRAAAYLCLAPVFVLGMNLARLVQRLSGHDPLCLRERQGFGFWLPADSAVRKKRYTHAMFCTEAMAGGRHGLLAAATVLLLTLGGAEAGLRFFGFGRPVLYVSDPVVGYYPGPHQRVERFHHSTLHVNNFGMRGPDLAPQPLPGVLRVFLIGDSTLYGGSYVSDKQLYPRLLETELNQAGVRRRVEVAPMGVNAWGPFHKLGYVQRNGVLGAEIAVVCMPIGDITRKHYGLEALPYMNVRHPPLLALEEVLFHLTWRYRARRLLDDAGGGPEQARSGIRAYRELAESMREKGAREVFFALLPARAGDRREWVDGLRDAVLPAAKGFDYPEDVFAGQDLNQVYHDNAHLDVLGHRLYSGHLARVLLSGSAVLAGERDGKENR